MFVRYSIPNRACKVYLENQKDIMENATLVFDELEKIEENHTSTSSPSEHVA